MPGNWRTSSWPSPVGSREPAVTPPTMEGARRHAGPDVTIVGVIGSPVAHSLSPLLHNAADDIAAETPFLVVRTMRDGRMDLFSAGVYLDRLREDTDGALRFVERLVVCDSSRFDTLLAIPL